jgi:hypothetical protein
LLSRSYPGAELYRDTFMLLQSFLKTSVEK